MAGVEVLLAAVPLVVRQRVALELHETAERCARRLEQIEDVPGLAGAFDLLANEEATYRALALLLTQPR